MAIVICQIMHIKNTRQMPDLKVLHKSQIDSCKRNLLSDWGKVCKGAKTRNRYNQVPHLPQDTYGIVTNSQLDTTNESQEASPFPAGDHKAHINRRAQRHSKLKTEKKQKKYRLGTVSIIFYWRA